MLYLDRRVLGYKEYAVLRGKVSAIPPRCAVTWSVYLAEGEM